MVVERDDLAIDDTIRQALERLGHGPEPLRPVEALARLQGDLAASDTRLDAIAVELDLMDPSATGRRPLHTLTELWRDEIRQVRRCGATRFRSSACSLGLCRLARPRLRRQALLAIPDGIGIDSLLGHQERLGRTAAPGGDRLHRSARGHRGVGFQDRIAIGIDRMVVAMLDQEPVCPLAAVAVMLHAHQHEAALQPLAVERELEVALLELALRAELALRLPVAPVPELDGAAAILALGDRPLEIAIGERMILDLDGEALVGGVERWSPGHGPGFEDAVQLQPQVVMQPRRIMFLDDEAQAI